MAALPPVDTSIQMRQAHIVRIGKIQIADQVFKEVQEILDRLGEHVYFELANNQEFGMASIENLQRNLKKGGVEILSSKDVDLVKNLSNNSFKIGMVSCAAAALVIGTLVLMGLTAPISLPVLAMLSVASLLCVMAALFALHNAIHQGHIADQKAREYQENVNAWNKFKNQEIEGPAKVGDQDVKILRNFEKMYNDVVGGPQLGLIAPFMSKEENPFASASGSGADTPDGESV